MTATDAPAVCPRTVRGPLGTPEWPCQLADGHDGNCRPSVAAHYTQQPPDQRLGRPRVTYDPAVLARIEREEDDNRQDALDDAASERAAATWAPLDEDGPR